MNKIVNFYQKIINKSVIKYVCMDCFDTIIHRKLHTDNLKMLWSKQVCNKLELRISPYMFYQIRKESEYSLMLEKGIVIREYSFNHLMQSVYDKLSFMYGIDISFNLFYQKSLELELEIEKEYGYVDAETKEAIDFFDSRKIKIVVVSDTCLSGKELKELLQKFEITGIDDIYSSSDYGDGKYSGKLYDKVIERLNTEPTNILMIGDNRKADIENAKAKGFKTYYKKWNNYPIAVKYADITEELLCLAKKQKVFPYENYAFVLYLFIDKLYSKIKTDGVSDILFLAREGEILKDLFDEYLKIIGDSSIKTYYFYTSRISSFASGLRSIDEETFEGLFRRYKDLSILTFLKSMGWEDAQINHLKRVSQLNLDNCIENFPLSLEFRNLKSNEAFIQLYDRHRMEQQKNFKQYLEDIHIDYKNGINIVDVGWRGSIQDNLFRCFQEKVSIHGYYIGISKIWGNSEKNLKEGIVFSEYPLKTKNFEIWNFDKFMFERIMLASHPTTVGYKIDEGKTKPIFKSFLNETESYQYILPYQKRVKELFICILRIFQNVVYSAEDFESIFTSIHLKMLCKIGIREVKMQKILYHYNHESFGEFGKSKANFFNEILTAFKMNKIPFRRILLNGLNFEYIQSISLTTICVTHGVGWILPILYRMLYRGEKKKMLDKVDL